MLDDSNCRSLTSGLQETILSRMKSSSYLLSLGGDCLKVLLEDWVTTAGPSGGGQMGTRFRRGQKWSLAMNVHANNTISNITEIC